MADSLELVAGKSPEQVPGQVERGADGAPFRALVDEALLEFVGEREVAAVVLTERSRAHDGSQVADLPAAGVAGVQLVGEIPVVVASAAVADSCVHQSR